jgi:hypothetical protein
MVLAVALKLPAMGDKPQITTTHQQGPESNGMVRKVYGAMGMPTESTTQRAATGSPNSQRTASMRISAGAMDD